jgi:TRAP-type C4-dicarboxylate transport system permease small subunit
LAVGSWQRAANANTSTSTSAKTQMPKFKKSATALCVFFALLCFAFTANFFCYKLKYLQ